MSDTFDGAKEPMRALRDLISTVECANTMRDVAVENDILSRAQEAFSALRKLFGDNRPGEEIAEAEMIEPEDLIDAFRVTAAALQCLAPLLPAREHHMIRFTGEWSRFGVQTVGAILNRANAALPKAED